jgi:hypothetical protein
MSSATGGYLRPTNSVLEGSAFMDFMHDWLVGITNLPNQNVRPMWQRNPPPIPSPETDWLAFGVSQQRQDDNAYMKMQDGNAALMRGEEIDIACVFYGDNSQDYANRLRDGLEITQNFDPLYQGIRYKTASVTTHVPEIINDIYYDRTDITITLVREVNRSYEVLSFVAASGVIDVDDAQSQPIELPFEVNEQEN